MFPLLSAVWNGFEVSIKKILNWQLLTARLIILDEVHLRVLCVFKKINTRNEAQWAKSYCRVHVQTIYSIMNGTVFVNACQFVLVSEYFIFF